MSKPRIFIGSSVESLNIADAINLNLDHQAEVTIWRNGTFSLSNNTIDDLVKKAFSVDFALFIFSPDDITIIRDQKKHVVRDNVIFELGLFIGALGKKRCFIIKPRNIDLHFPTDLLGITPADYDPNRSDEDLTSAVNHACVLVKNEINRIQNEEPKKPSIIRQNDITLNDLEFNLLSCLLCTATTHSEGLSMWRIKQDLKNESQKIDLIVLKLIKNGFSDRIIAVDETNEEYFAFRITGLGIEYLLENEAKIDSPAETIQFQIPGFKNNSF
jgi:hypothetical protein